MFYTKYVYFTQEHEYIWLKEILELVDREVGLWWEESNIKILKDSEKGCHSFFARNTSV